MKAKNHAKHPGAVLLTSFTFPGLAQIYLGRKLRGLVFAAAAAVAFGVCIQRVAVFMREVVDEAGEAIETMEDPTATVESLLEGKFQDPGISGPLALFGVVWLVSFVDAWRLFAARRKTSQAWEAETTAEFAPGPSVELIATEIFDISGRGAVVVAYGVVSGFGANDTLWAEFTGTDGAMRRVRASRELLLKRTENGAVESEAFVLQGVKADEVAAGSTVKIRASAA